MQLNHALRQQIAGSLAGFDRRSLSAPGSRRAAVALALIEEGTGAMVPGVDAPSDWSHSAAMLLTRRSDQLRNHPGQWALPGGSIDERESSEQAALREGSEVAFFPPVTGG